jgi:hypothetical protein
MSRQSLQILSDKIYFYNSVTVLPIGIGLNAICLFVFSKNSLNKKTSIGYLYAILSAFNILTLLNQVIYSAFIYYEVDLFSLSGTHCVLYNAAFSFFLHLPSTQQMIISLYMFFNVFNSNRWFSKYLGKKFYILAIFFYVLILLVGKLPYFFFFVNAKIEHVNSTDANLNSTSLHYDYSCTTDSNRIDFASDMMDLLFRAYLPFMIIFTLNFLIIRRLTNSKKLIRSDTQSNNSRVESMKKFKRETTFALTVISMNGIYLFLYLPWSIAFTLFHVSEYVGYNLNKSITASNNSSLELATTITDCVAYINNYSLFFISFQYNHLFKKEITKYFLKLKVESNLIKSTAETNRGYVNKTFFRSERRINLEQS